MTVRPLIASVVLLAGCTPALNPTGAPHVRHEVQVEGRPYVVTVTGSLAVIAARGLLTQRSPAVVRQMHEAVRIATGCELTEEQFYGPNLSRQLDCSAANDDAADAVVEPDAIAEVVKD